MADKTRIVEESEYLKSSAVDDAERWFEHVIHILEGQIRDVKKYREDFRKSCAEKDPWAKPGDILSWAVNSTSHIESNLRKADTLRISATLAVAANMERKS